AAAGPRRRGRTDAAALLVVPGQDVGDGRGLNEGEPPSGVWLVEGPTPARRFSVSHANARTTFHGRKLIVARHQAGWKKAHIAAAMGLSRKCVRTWITRFEDEGESGLVDRSSRPHTRPTRTPVEVEDRIVATRTEQRRGPDWIGAELGVPARTVSRVLARREQPRLCELDP